MRIFEARSQQAEIPSDTVIYVIYYVIVILHAYEP